MTGALPELGDMSVGLLHLLIAHTSASLALSENLCEHRNRDGARSVVATAWGETGE